MNQRLEFRRTTFISIGLLAFLTGLFAAKAYRVEVQLITIAVIAASVYLFRKKQAILLVLVVLLGGGLGLWRGAGMAKEVKGYDSYIESNVVAHGSVADDPVYDDKGRLDFRLNNVEINGQSLPGEIRLKAFANGLRRGDRVRAAGSLRDGFGNYQAAMYFADIDILANSRSPIETIRREFFAAVYSVLPEPEGSLGLGFLVGLRSALPEDFDDQLRVAGLTHIVVASGYNLTILVRISRRLLAKYSKYQAFVGSVTLILLFLAITGASPSIVRASVVTILSLVAWYYGRKFQPVLIILLGAALTAGFNPLYIWHDLGWWLSFLAFTGVLLIAPMTSAFFYDKSSPPLLIQVAIETVSAQIMATPLILFTFGEISMVAVLANIAVVPLIPLAMTATFIGGLAGIVLNGAWAAWLAVPAQLILGYMVAATRFFASFDWAHQAVEVTSVVMVSLYFMVLLAVWMTINKAKINFSSLPTITD